MILENFGLTPPNSNHTSPWYEAPPPPGILFDGFRLWEFPTYSFDSPTSIRCGRDNPTWANSNSVLKVKAGDTIEFAATNIRPYDWDRPEEIQWDCPEGRGTCIEGIPEVSNPRLVCIIFWEILTHG